LRKAAFVAPQNKGIMLYYIYIYTYNYHIMHGSAIPWPWIKSPCRPTYKYACTAKALFSGTKAGWIEPGGTDLVVRCHRVWCTALWNNTFLLVLEMRKTRLKAALDSIHAEPRTLCRQHNQTVSVFLRSVAVLSFYFIKIAQLQMDFRRAGCASSSALLRTRNAAHGHHGRLGMGPCRRCFKTWNGDPSKPDSLGM
jgi:hypothetical protein